MAFSLVANSTGLTVDGIIAGGGSMAYVIIGVLFVGGIGVLAIVNALPLHAIVEFYITGGKKNHFRSART